MKKPANGTNQPGHWRPPSGRAAGAARRPRQRCDAQHKKSLFKSLFRNVAASCCRHSVGAPRPAEWLANGSIFLYAFDLIEPNGDGPRRDPLEVRKATLASIVAKASPGHSVQPTHGRRRPDRLRPRLQARPRRDRLEAEGFRLPFRPLARLAQNEELGCTGREARRRGRMGQKEMAMSYGPKTERILAGVLTVASGGWLILILLGHLEPLG